MEDTFKINRLEFNILKCLYDSGCTDPYHSITITELLEKNEVSDKRMTLYKKLNKLIKDADNVTKYLVVDENNVIQTDEYGMTFMELAEFTGYSIVEE